MKLDIDNLIQKSLESGADRAAIIDVSKIIFLEDFRHICEQNKCGKYGSNWMCPPAIGSLEDLKAKINSFKNGLVIQTVRKLEDSFDFEGMMKAKSDHEVIFRNILEKIKSQGLLEQVFPLGAGACTLCKKCAFTNGEKCRFPDKAFPPMEACGIDVNAFVTSCGIPYYNGKDTVSYVGAFLFNE